MPTLALIGFLGGLVTGISPCILRVLPVIFFSGAGGSRRPYVVIAGLALSFSVVTLIGSTLLTLLHVPQDAIRGALLLLVLIGLGLIFPVVERLLERPFARIPQRQIDTGGNGFTLGLVLGVLFVPCAGPVLAAIVVAGATGSIGLPTITLTVGFALGAALPLLVFALAGKRISQRVSAFRRRQRSIRIVGGVAMILLAVALVSDVPAALQRTIPDYTASLQDRVADDAEIQEKLNLGGIVTDENRQLSNCANGGRELQDAAPHRESRASPNGSTHPTARWSTSHRYAARSCSSTSGRTRASTASARSRTSPVGTTLTATKGSPSSASTPPSTRSRRCPPTLRVAPESSASPTRSRWTTGSRRGPTTATGTGPRGI